jgi:hypothetical protein
MGAKVRLSERKSKLIWVFPNESTFDEVKGSAIFIKNKVQKQIFHASLFTFHFFLLPLHPQIAFALDL